MRQWWIYGIAVLCIVTGVRAQFSNFLFMAEPPAIGTLRLRLSGFYTSANAFYNADGQLISVLRLNADTLGYQERWRLEYQQWGTEVEAELRPWQLSSITVGVRLEQFRHVTTHTRLYEGGLRYRFDSVYTTVRFPTLYGGIRLFLRKRAQSQFALQPQIVLRPPMFTDDSVLFRAPKVEVHLTAEGSATIHNGQLHFRVGYQWRSPPYNDVLALTTSYRLPIVHSTRLHLFARSILSLLTPQEDFPTTQQPVREQWIDGGMVFHVFVSEQIFAEAGFSVLLWGKNVWNRNIIWGAIGLFLPDVLASSP